MRAASIEEKGVPDGGLTVGAVALPRRKQVRWAFLDTWGWGGASLAKEGGGGVLGRGRDGTEGKKSDGRCSVLFIGAATMRQGGIRGTVRHVKGGGLVPTGGRRPGRPRPKHGAHGRCGAVQTGERRGPLTRGP
jgi:hypothetical protein